MLDFVTHRLWSTVPKLVKKAVMDATFRVIDYYNTLIE